MKVYVLPTCILQLLNARNTAEDSPFIICALYKGLPFGRVSSSIKGRDSTLAFGMNNSFKILMLGKIKLVKPADIIRLKTLHPIELYQKEKISTEIFDCGVD